jgi:hypothetical protein
MASLREILAEIDSSTTLSENFRLVGAFEEMALRLEEENLRLREEVARLAGTFPAGSPPGPRFQPV